MTQHPEEENTTSGFLGSPRPGDLLSQLFQMERPWDGNTFTHMCCSCSEVLEVVDVYGRVGKMVVKINYQIKPHSSGYVSRLGIRPKQYFQVLDYNKLRQSAAMNLPLLTFSVFREHVSAPSQTGACSEENAHCIVFFDNEEVIRYNVYYETMYLLIWY